MRRTWAVVIALAVVAAPQVADLYLRPEGRSLERAVDVSSMVVYVALLIGSLLYYFYWRISDGNRSAWLTAGLMVVSAQGLTWSAWTAVSSPTSNPGWLLLGDLVTTLVLLAFVVASTRLVLTIDPAIAGVGAGALVSLTQLLLYAQAPPLDLPSELELVLRAVLGLLSLTVAAFLLRLESVSAWVRTELVSVTVLVFLARGLAYVEQPPDWVRLGAVISGWLGASILLRAAYFLLRRAIRKQQQALRSMEQRLNEVENGSRVHRARLHEVRSTISGITSASRLVRRRHGLSGDMRRQLERMIESELARLERIMGSRAVSPPGVVEVDEVIEDLVLAQRAKGHRVEWERSGVLAWGRPDDLAEVVHILVTNAATHGGNGTIRVEAHESDEGAEIVVADSGPGVSAALRDQIFDWGARGPDSRGQGIGLHIAQQLMRDQGGALTLAEHDGTGATFVVKLPGPGAGQEEPPRSDGARRATGQ